MLLALWSPKGGSGTSVVAAAVSLVLARRGPARLVDLAGDQPAIFGLPPEPGRTEGGGLTEWLARGPLSPTEALDAAERAVAPALTLLALTSVPDEMIPAESGAALAAALRDGPPTVVDAGLAAGAPAARDLVEAADASVVVVRGCYLALRRAVRCPLVGRAAGVVLVEEPGRALAAQDVADVLGRPVLARFPLRSSVSRAVDAGVLAGRLPGHLAAPAEVLLDALARAAAGRAA